MNISPHSILKVETKPSAIERKPKLLDRLREALHSCSEPGRSLSMIDGNHIRTPHEQ